MLSASEEGGAPLFRREAHVLPEGRGQAQDEAGEGSNPVLLNCYVHVYTWQEQYIVKGELCACH